MRNKILYIATHPDDETLGCGGTILRHNVLGASSYWLIVTKAYTKDGFSQKSIKDREKEVKRVAKEYKFKRTYELKLPTTMLDTISIKKIVGMISSVIQKVKPNVLFVPNESDVHTDHKIVFNASWSAAKIFRNNSIKEIYAYETISETEFSAPLKKDVQRFVPNTFYDITKYMGRKIKIMEIYKSELRRHPFPRSKKNIKALATYRGAIAGLKYAEAFMCLKKIA